MITPRPLAATPCLRLPSLAARVCPLASFFLPFTIVCTAGCGHRAPHGGTVTPPRGATQVLTGHAAVSSDPHEVYFENVTRSAGINYKWVIAGNRPLTILQTIGNGCAFLDYNNDGNLDILLVGPTVALYKGDGKGHFTDASHDTGLDRLEGSFLGCAVGDFDNDGFADIYLTAYRGGALLHNESGSVAAGKYGSTAESASKLPPLQTSTRAFRDVTVQSGIPAQAWATSAAFVDVDNDGKLDLFICNYVNFGPDTKPQLCEYSGKLSACGPRFYQPEKGRLYHNDGSKFRDITQNWQLGGASGIEGKDLGIACADFNGSGHQGIALANDEVAGDLLTNVGGRFKNVGSSSGTAYDSEGNVHGGMGIDWGDYDNDGKLDLAVATFQYEVKNIYHNRGSDFFDDQAAALGLGDKTSPTVAFGLKWLDFNNDGWLDLVIANGHVQDNISDIDANATYKQTVQLFRNELGKHFADASSQAGPAFRVPIVGRGLAIGDYDNDGKVDVLVVDSEGEPLLLHNVTPHAGNWLEVRLAGTRSNRDGIGALLTFTTADGKKLLRRCATDGSYMSASDPRVHCGLGSASSADITVRWPSGRSSTIHGVKAGQLLNVPES